MSVRHNGHTNPKFVKEVSFQRASTSFISKMHIKSQRHVSFISSECRTHTRHIENVKGDSISVERAHNIN